MFKYIENVLEQRLDTIWSLYDEFEIKLLKSGTSMTLDESGKLAMLTNWEASM